MKSKLKTHYQIALTSSRLVEVHEPDLIAKYAYDGNGLRVQKSVNGATSRQIWDGSQIALERAPAASSFRLHYYGLGRYASRDEAGKTTFYIYNTHNDVVKLVGTSGNVIHEYDYDAFGVERSPDAADANPWRYCGEYFDKETSTIYLRSRNYSPNLGRFTQEDVARDGSNWYVYVYSSPIVWVDPSGKFGKNTVLQNGVTKGNNMPDTTKLQRALVAQGFLVMPEGAKYGYFGELTEAAVKSFQESKGLEATGSVGFETWKALGLRVNNTFEKQILATGTPESYQKGGAITGNVDFMEANGSLSSGSFGGERDGVAWSVGLPSIEGAVQFNQDGIELGATVAAFDASISVDIPIPNTNKRLQISGNVSVGSIGGRVRTTLKKGVGVKGSVGAGAGINIRVINGDYE